MLDAGLQYKACLLSNECTLLMEKGAGKWSHRLRNADGADKGGFTSRDWPSVRGP